MNPVKVILMGTGRPAIQIGQYLRDSGVRLERLYLSRKCELNDEIIQSTGISRENVFYARDYRDAKHVDILCQTQYDFLITVYWPYLLDKKIFGTPKRGTINFHPALLPLNRGWYPHVYSIVDGSVPGVSLHQITEAVDAGDVWAQKRIVIHPADTAKEVYERQIEEIVALFKESWPNILNGTLKPVPQNHAHATFHAKDEVATLDYIDLNKKYSGRELLNILRARSFGNKGFAYIFDEGKKIFLNLRLSDSNSFGNKEEKK